MSRFFIIKHTLMPLTDRGIFLESTRAEWRKRLWLQKVKIISMTIVKWLSKKKIQRTSIYTYGITIAPRSEIASLVAPVPLSWGTKSPWRTSEESGFAYPSSTKKHTATVSTRNAIKNSSVRTYNVSTLHCQMNKWQKDRYKDICFKLVLIYVCCTCVPR